MLKLITLCGSPKSGKTQLALELAVKTAETKNVVFFTDDDKTFLEHINNVHTTNLKFYTLFSIELLLSLVTIGSKPDLVIIDCRFIESSEKQKISNIADKVQTQIMLIENTPPCSKSAI